MTDFEKFRQQYLRSKRPKGILRVMQRARLEKAAERTRHRAQLLCGALADDLTRADAALLCGCSEEALKKWLHKQTGSTNWPPSSEGAEKLRDLCK